VARATGSGVYTVLLLSPTLLTGSGVFMVLLLRYVTTAKTDTWWIKGLVTVVSVLIVGHACECLPAVVGDRSRKRSGICRPSR